MVLEMGHHEQDRSRICHDLGSPKRKGEILRYEYEGITLRFSGVKYTPDFVVFLPDDWVEPVGPINGGIKFIEVKATVHERKV